MVVCRCEKFLLTGITFEVFELEICATFQIKGLDEFFPKRTYFLYFEFWKVKISSLKGSVMKSGKYCAKKRTSWLEYRIIRLPGNLSLKYRFVMCLHDRIPLVIRCCSHNSSKAMEVTKCLLSWNASLFYLHFLSILTKYQSFLVSFLVNYSRWGEKRKIEIYHQIICP